MGFLGSFRKLTQVGFDVVTSPIEVAKDVLTIGSALTDEQEPYSMRRLRRIADKLDEAYEELDHED